MSDVKFLQSKTARRPDGQTNMPDYIELYVTHTDPKWKVCMFIKHTVKVYLFIKHHGSAQINNQ